MAAYSTQAALVGHFKFNGSLNDETGNHNGTLRDSLETPLYVPGISGDALQIDTVGSSVECANPTAFVLSHDFTIAAWVKTTKAGEVLVVYKGPRDAYGAKSRQFEVYGGGGLGGKGEFIHTGDSGAYGTSFEPNGITVNDDQWHHIAVTYSASTTPHFTLYMDGIGKVGTDPGRFFNADFVMQPDGTDTNQVLRIGGRDEGGGYTVFVGLMDDVQFYNRPLSSNQVNVIFNNPGQTAASPTNIILFTQPVPIQSVGEGSNVTLSVEAEGQAPLSYQWKLNGVNVPGATSTSLTLSNVNTNQSGNYTVTVSNPAANLTSDPGNLVVLAGGLPVVELHMYAGITLYGLPGQRYDIQYADVLGQTTNWVKVGATITLGNPSVPPIRFDLTSVNAPGRFYRAVLVP